MTPMPLTPRQAAVLHVVERLTQQMGYPPTSKELASHAGMSETRVRQHLDVLETRGAITRQPGTARSITVQQKVTA